MIDFELTVSNLYTQVSDAKLATSRPSKKITDVQIRKKIHPKDVL